MSRLMCVACDTRLGWSHAYRCHLPGVVVLEQCRPALNLNPWEDTDGCV